MKIAYVTPYEGEKAIAEELLTEHDVIFHDTPVRDEIPSELADVEVLSIFVDSHVNEAMIDSMPNLKVIALRSMGFDHVPAAYAAEKGIVVTYVPHYGAQTVAEFAFGLMLALSRKVYASYDALRTTGEVFIKRFEGFDLNGKTLGVVGTGGIGRHTCQIGQGFGMEVIAHDLYPNEAFAAERGIVYTELPELLAVADIVSLHVPSSPENKHLINRESIQQMKSGAILINTARGDLVDTVALLEAVKDGQLSGAGLDVFEGERYIRDEMELLQDGTAYDDETWKAFAAEHELLDLEQVIVTPHVAFNSREAKREITETTAANIAAALAGEPQNTVSGGA